MIETTKYHRMIDAFKASHGEEVAMTLAESLRTDHLATKADLEPLATKADLKADLALVREQMAAMESRLGEKLTEMINKQLWRLFGAVLLLIVAGIAQQIFS